MLNILANVAAVLLMLCSIGGLLVAFLISTAIMPWAVAVLVSYVLIRIEATNRKTDVLLALFSD